MTPDDFRAFYRAVHGYEPFPWQTRLLRQVAEKGWPAVLALPTACGKTSAIDIAVFALAMQVGRPLHKRSAPLRIFFVIDRRLVVDQAAKHAHSLREALEKPEAGSGPGAAVVREVADALRRFGGPGPLHVAALRGGIYRDDVWARAPNQPTVCVSTVDQVGSRLLFRGYGVSEYARPVHAALVGNDALYIMDEAHLSQPFLETLDAVRCFRAGPWAQRPGGGPFHVVEMSATPQSEGERFALEEDDYANAELNKRLAAPKPARLVEPARFETEAAELAVAARSGEVKVVGVVVNRVASARDIFSRLPGEPFEDKVLLTGRIRPWDRDALLARCRDRMMASRRLKKHPDGSSHGPPLYVVATMTVEVGADLDFDHLVTEAAPLPALRQRFGRLDRLGRLGNAAGSVLLRKARGPDPIYGDELADAWGWLREQAAASSGVLDFGVNALDERIRAADKRPPAPAPRHAPPLLPAHLDSWVQTSPEPRPTPDVPPFLHGADALDAVDVQIVWRADLRPGHEDEWLDTVAAAPPRSREALALPVDAARAWLAQGAPAEVADVEGVAAPSAPPLGGRRALRWRGPDAEDSNRVGPGDIQPGDTLVVPSAYGGADAFGWDGGAVEPVADVGDQCVNDMAARAPEDGVRRMIRLRLYPGVQGMPPTVDQPADELRKALQAGEDGDAALDDLLAAMRDNPPADGLTAAVVEQLTRTRPRVSVYPAGVVLSARVLPGFFRTDAERAETDDGADDDTSSQRAGTYAPAAVELGRHVEGVARWAEAFAAGLGLGDDLRGLLSSAARLHDLGKADPRFQFLLYGDEPAEVLLAKSGRDLDDRERGMVRSRSGLPRGFRHEFVSVALLRRHGAELLEGLDDEQRRLVVYLVGVHHGRGRPFVPVAEDDGKEPVSLVWEGHELSVSPNHGLWRLDSGWADGFWALVRRHGYWGLAYLEALLRLADGARSAEEQRQGRVCE